MARCPRPAVGQGLPRAPSAPGGRAVGRPRRRRADERLRGPGPHRRGAVPRHPRHPPGAGRASGVAHRRARSADRVHRPRRHQLRARLPPPRPVADTVGVGPAGDAARVHQPAGRPAGRRRPRVQPQLTVRRRAPRARSAHRLTSRSLAVLDPEALRQFQLRLFSKLEGAMTSGMVHLGDRLGLYRALAEAGPSTSAELAGRTALVERWVREWAYNQAAAGLVEVDEGERFSLTPEAVAVLADPDHEAAGLGLFHQLPVTMAALPAIAESFHTGIGHDYDSCGADGAIGGERGFEPWNRA